MSQRFARSILLLLLAAWIALFGLSPETRRYAIQSFSCGDSAFSFYDDFPSSANKSLFPFKVLSVFALWLIYKVGQEPANSAPASRKRLLLLLFIGGALIFLWWSSALVVLSSLLLLCYPWKNSETAGKNTRWVLAALIVIALTLRLEKIPNVASSPLQPDASQYVQLSQTMTWFYDTQHREPLLAGIDRILTLFFPVPEDLTTSGYLPVRLLTVVLSCGVVAAIFMIGRALFSHRTAFLAALLFAVNKAFVYRSLQGLRVELLILGILGVVALASRSPCGASKNLCRGVLLGVVGGLLLLVRTACLPFVVFVYCLAWWKGTYTARACAIAAIICAVLVIPYHIYCWNEYGDPMYSGNYHVNKFYYMTVFETGAPDTSHEPFVKPFELMFSIFPRYKTALLTLEGVLDTLFGRYALRLFYLPFSPLLIGCSALAYIRWIQDKRCWPLGPMLLLLLGPMAFILAMLNHSPVVFDWRTVAHLFPFMALAAVDGLFYLLDRAGAASPAPTPGEVSPGSSL
ncbi:MAG: hypothetical protein ABIH23_09640 [bacterium]